MSKAGGPVANQPQAKHSANMVAALIRFSEVGFLGSVFGRPHAEYDVADASAQM